MDPLMPLAASVMCVENGLPPDESVALTAAAMIIEGPLALAPALVAVERRRERRGIRPSTPPPPPKKDIGPALVAVPNVIDATEADAVKQLADVKLRSSVSYNRSDAKQDGKVLRQHPEASSGLVTEGTMVRLHVGAAPPLDSSDAEELDQIEASIVTLKTDVDEKFANAATATQEIKAQLQALQDAIARLPQGSAADTSTTAKPTGVKP